MDLAQWIESNHSMFTHLSNEVWGYAELGYKEFESSKTLEDALEEAGFKLERGVAEIPTAFVASYGNAAEPVIGILSENSMPCPVSAWIACPIESRLPVVRPVTVADIICSVSLGWRLLWRSNKPWMQVKSKARSAITVARPKKVAQAKPLWQMPVYSMMQIFV